MKIQDSKGTAKMLMSFSPAHKEGEAREESVTSAGVGIRDSKTI